jgi:hypothetical protein
VRNHLVVWTIVLGLAAGFSVMAAKKAAPKQIVIKECQKAKPPVAFPHETHTKKAKVACKTCHHKGQDQTCGAAKCHAGKAEGKRPGCAEMSPSKNPYHISCIGCHKKQNKGPKGCGDCHKK